jgi:hypothetical protein
MSRKGFFDWEGRSPEELFRERDRKLIALKRAMRDIGPRRYGDISTILWRLISAQSLAAQSCPRPWAQLKRKPYRRWRERQAPRGVSRRDTFPSVNLAGARVVSIERFCQPGDFAEKLLEVLGREARGFQNAVGYIKCMLP